MKKLSYITLFLVALLNFSCDTNDDTFYKTIYVEGGNHIVTIHTQPSYSVGDYFRVTADLSRYIPEPGQTQTALLDIYKTTGNAQSFYFSYVFEKKSSTNEWEVVSVDDSQLSIAAGQALNGPYVYAVCQYNPTDEYYRYDVGFPLLSAGEYRLSMGYNSSSTNSVELISQSSSNNLIVNLNAAMNNLDANGYYHFTVN